MEFSSPTFNFTFLWSLARVNDDLLSSIHYRAAKIIMKTKVTMSIAALFIEPGWESINDFMNRQSLIFSLYK